MYHGKGSVDWKGTLNEFMNGRTIYGPWLQHIIGWKKVGIEDNVLHLSYENMQECFRDAVRKLGTFLQVNLSDEEIDKIEKFCAVDKMRKSIHKNLILDDAVFKGEAHEFIRKGIVGDWKNHFLVAQNEVFDKEIVAKLEEEGIFMKY
ncbi:sulfotransferase 2A8-like [Glandiceps talaboti]